MFIQFNEWILNLSSNARFIIVFVVLIVLAVINTVLSELYHFPHLVLVFGVAAIFIVQHAVYRFMKP
jgi:hypothetical protein